MVGSEGASRHFFYCFSSYHGQIVCCCAQGSNGQNSHVDGGERKDTLCRYYVVSTLPDELDKKKKRIRAHVEVERVNMIDYRSNTIDY